MFSKINNWLITKTFTSENISIKTVAKKLKQSDDYQSILVANKTGCLQSDIIIALSMDLRNLRSPA